MNIYVASSWRNKRQPEVVKFLRHTGYQVYDFRSPSGGVDGFHWSEIDPDWQQWSPTEFCIALNTVKADEGFRKDLEAMRWADVFVLVQPCGSSAHLELGWAIGAGKEAVILLSDGEPELMYKLANYRATSMEELRVALMLIEAAGE